MYESNKGNNGKTRKVSHKIRRLVFFVFTVFLLTIVSVILVDHFLIPNLAAVKWLGKYKFLKKATEDVVVVNKTEQVTVSEDLTIARYSNKSAASVVEIVSEAELVKNILHPAEVARAQNKTGSGLVVTADGLILTYSEGILPDHASYKIFASGNSSYDARLLTVDSFSGLALLKIDNVSDLPTTSFIAPEDIKIGAKVFAMGKNGTDVGTIYKSGLLSQFASDFSLAGPLASSDKLQGVYFADFDMNDIGDESLNGATIADYNGDVIGILGSMKTANRNQYFIIPANFAEDLVNRYISSGSVKRASLGLYYLPLTKETSGIAPNNNERGALVFSTSNQQGLAVISGGAADKAGIKISDVVKSVGGEEVNENHNLASLIAKYKPGDEIELGILRSGQDMGIKAVLQ